MMSAPPRTTPIQFGQSVPAAAALTAAAIAAWSGSAFLHPLALSPGGIRNLSAGYLLLTAGLAWTISYATCRLLRRDKPPEARQVALRTSLSASWLVPAAFFLRDASEWALVALAAFALSTFRLLNLSRAPRLDSANLPAPELFARPPVAAGRDQRGAIAGVLLVEAALLTAIFTQTLLAALLMVAGAWLCARRYDQKRTLAVAPRPPRATWHLSAAAALTVLALLPHLLVPFGASDSGSYGTAGGRDWSLLRAFKLLLGFRPATVGAPGAEPRAAAAPGGHSVPKLNGTPFPGVVIYAGSRVTTLVAPPAVELNGSGFGRISANPLTIPFSGVYWIMRQSNQPPPPASLVWQGSPAQRNFFSNDFAPLWMEAHQNFGAFISIGCCRALRLEFTDADYYSNQVALELVLSNSLQHRTRSLGTKPIESSPIDPRPQHRSLIFRLPLRDGFEQFDGLIVRFWLRDRHSFRSARIGVERFVLLPAGG